MDGETEQLIRTANIVLNCSDLNRALALFKEELGFQSEATFGADDPSIAVISGQGFRIRLERAMPPLQASNWHEGRVKGMFYRDLIPGRQGGRFIASHIRILNEGRVDDDVHFHLIRFQMIYCYKGRVRLVYEGRPEFVMKAGDCVLQPPQIRHQVLEVLEPLEVIEICSPAEHWTVHDRNLDLTKSTAQPDRTFDGGQRFVYHDADRAVWQPHQRLDGFEYRDSGIAAATNDLAGARVIRPRREARPRRFTHNGDLFFMFVLCGELTVNCERRRETKLAARDSFVVPAGIEHELTQCSNDLELLEVTLPA
jgi:mannose-6-phosphate isomerase-like protein (cupin superfamily)